MHRQIYQKFTLHFSLFGVAISILVGFYDVILGYIWEIIHIVLEIIEITLDGLIEHSFETEVHETQVIVFYIMLAIGGVLIYFLWKALAHVFTGVGKNLKKDCSDLRLAITSDWHAMSFTGRIIFISVFLLVNYLASFLLF